MDLVSWSLTSQASDIDKPLLIDALDDLRYLSFRQVRSCVRKLVSGLQAIGIQPGDCVCLSSFNDIYYYVLYLGIIGAGAQFTGTNPAYTTHEMVHHLRMTNAKALIVEPKLLDNALAAIRECDLPESRVFVLDIHERNQRPDLASWNVLLQHGERDWVAVADPDETVATIASTSGTSGLPKGALLSHSYHVTQAQMRNGETPPPYEVRRLTALPPFHVFATPIVPASLRNGCPTYIMRRYDTALFIAAIAKFRISETWVPPPVLTGIPKSSLATREGMRSLRQIWMGGGAVSFANQKPMYDLMHADSRINQVWGMTEGGWVTTTCWPEKMEDDSVGRALPGFELRVADDNDIPLATPLATGNLLVRGSHLMKGYINNPTATRDAFTAPDSNGHIWLRTGDVGHLSADGRVFVIDRKKELIKVRGWQVSPAEVEGALLVHPRVSDVAVIGVPAPLLPAVITLNGMARRNRSSTSVSKSGTSTPRRPATPGFVDEIPRAYVVLRPATRSRAHIPDDVEEIAEELKVFAAQRLARYKVPQEVVFVAAIPKNSTGKILRRVLREQVQNADLEKVGVELDVQPPVPEISAIVATGNRSRSPAAQGEVVVKTTVTVTTTESIPGSSSSARSTTSATGQADEEEARARRRSWQEKLAELMKMKNSRQVSIKPRGFWGRVFKRSSIGAAA